MAGVYEIMHRTMRLTFSLSVMLCGTILAQQPNATKYTIAKLNAECERLETSLVYTNYSLKGSTFVYEGKTAECRIISMNGAGVLCEVEGDLMNIVWDSLPLKIVAMGNPERILKQIHINETKIRDCRKEIAGRIRSRIKNRKGQRIQRIKREIETRIAAERKFVIDKSFFGTKLGECDNAVESACKAAGHFIHRTAWKFTDEDHPGVIWTISGAMNGNTSIKRTRLCFFEHRLYQIEVLFRDSSLQNYHVIKDSLEKKYGNNKPGFMDAIESKAKFEVNIDGHAVCIVINHDTAFMEDDTLALLYTHDKLLDAVLQEMNRRKASKIVDDL